MFVNVYFEHNLTVENVLVNSKNGFRPIKKPLEIEFHRLLSEL